MQSSKHKHISGIEDSLVQINELLLERSNIHLKHENGAFKVFIFDENYNQRTTEQGGQEMKNSLHFVES